MKYSLNEWCVAGGSRARAIPAFPRRRLCDGMKSSDSQSQLFEVEFQFCHGEILILGKALNPRASVPVCKASYTHKTNWVVWRYKCAHEVFSTVLGYRSVHIFSYNCNTATGRPNVWFFKRKNLIKPEAVSVLGIPVCLHKACCCCCCC